VATLEQHLLREQLEQDPMLFMRYFFKQRMGSKLLIGEHHAAIMSALNRVLTGEINRLIINVPPGYTKTELCTINMMAYGLAINPKAKFLHLSYSHSLALLNSSTSRAIIKSPAFQSMWPIELKDDADSKAMWWTEQGGGVYATSSAGQVTVCVCCFNELIIVYTMNECKLFLKYFTHKKAPQVRGKTLNRFCYTSIIPAPILNQLYAVNADSSS